MNNNKIILFICVITLILVVAIPSVIQVSKRHNEKLYYTLSLKITEAAKKCVNENKCNDDKIFIKELYEKDYLKKTINPITNNEVSEDSYVTKKEGKYVFVDITPL